MDEIIQNTRKLIANGKIEKALEILKKEVKNSDRLNNVLLQDARLSDINEEVVSGTMDSSDAHKFTNQVIKSTLKIISDLEEWGSKDNPVPKPGIKLIEVNLVDEISLGYKKAIRFYMRIAFLPLIVSLAFIGFVLIKSQSVETFQALASTLIASISAFPIRAIVNRREKISILNVLIKKIGFLKTNPEQKEITKVNDIFWGLVDSTLSKSSD